VTEMNTFSKVFSRTTLKLKLPHNQHLGSKSISFRKTINYTTARKAC